MLRRIRAAIGLLLLASLGGAGCSEAATTASVSSPAGLPDRDPALARRLVEQERAVLLDVRTPGEFASGALPGAVNVPVEGLAGRLAAIEALTGGDKGRAIVVYCRSGRRSAAAKALLLEAGYERVTNLGSVRDWR